MRVLELIHGLGVGGAENSLAQLVRQLRERGHQIEIGCLDETGALGRQLQSEGFPLRLYGRKPGFDPSVALRIARHWRQSQASVLHAHQYSAFFYGRLAKPLARRPIVYTEHGLLAPPRGWKRRVAGRLAGGADAVTAVSPAVERHLVTAWGHSGPIEILPNGVDTARFRPATTAQRAAARSQLGIASEARVVGSVGRLVPVKNVALLLRAFARIARPLDRLLVIGEGDRRPALEALARELELGERALFLGQRLDIDRLLPAFDLYGSTSLHEGMPLALLEAAAAGVPIVATAVGGVPEMLRDGDEIALVRGRPPDGHREPEAEGADYLSELAGTLESLLGDPALRSRMAAAARTRVVEAYEARDVCDRYISLLERVARSASAPAARC